MTDGTCPGCGVILTEADYVAGECRNCHWELEDR